MRSVLATLGARRGALLGLTAATLLAARSVGAQQLYGCDRNGRLFTVNLTNGAGTHVCDLPIYPDPGATEIEFDDLTSLAWVQTRDGTFNGQLFDILTCAGIGALKPTNNLSINGLEFVGGTLYGAAIPFACEPSTLVRLDPLTGAVVSIGPTGAGPIAGLAYDLASATMYGVTGCSTAGFSELVTVDLATGAATSVGSTGVYLGSLEFGPTGLLYAGGSNLDGGNIYTVDTATGAATLLGPSGFGSVTGLTQAVGQTVTVLVTRFDARATGDGIRLEWDVFADEDLLGFTIYRGVAGGPVRVLDGGMMAAHARSFVDDRIAGGTTYAYTLAVVRSDGSEVLSPVVSAQAPAHAWALHPNTPNPFNPTTRISFTLPQRERVDLSVYDVRGRHVTTLTDATLNEGTHEAVWDGTDASGRRVGSGVYFCRLASGARTLTRKMLLVK
jgi:hypothetical protein